MVHARGVVQRVNPDTLTWTRVTEARWHDELLRLVETHARETGSRYAALLLHEWTEALQHFWHVVPKEYAKHLAAPEVERAVLVG